MKAIVLAAGKGKRLLSEKNDLPKVMRIANGNPLLSYVLDNISFIPKKDTVIVVGYKKEAVMENIGSEYSYAFQDEQLGTGHAVKMTEGLLKGSDDDILICYGDMPLFLKSSYENMADAHKKSGADCTVMTAVAPNSGLAYGRVIRENGKFSEVIEQKDCTPEEFKITELNVGIYIIKENVLFSALNKLKNENTQGEYYLTDIAKILIDDGKSVETFSIHNGNEIYGVNTLEDLELCEKVLKSMKDSSLSIKNKKWFGTGGWRAIIGDEFTRENLQRLMQAISDDMISKNFSEIVIGFDRRFLSDKSAVWAAEVFAANNISVYYISRISPTPLVMYAVKTINCEYGIAITASHNPADYNGVKIFTKGGNDAAPSITDNFERILDMGVNVKSTPFASAVKAGRIRIIDPNNDYMDTIISMLDMQAIRDAQLKIVLDPMFGVSKTTLQTILMTARCDVDIINDRHDTLFGGRLPSPSAATLTKLRDMVVERSYNLGIATDGDADRIGIIDNLGNFVHPNEIMILIYHYLIKFKGMSGDCVRNVATTHILDKIAASFNFKCHEVPVGFKHISSKMEETDAIIGGESSGGLTIKGHIKGKDGIFASSLLVEMISVTKKTIPELLDEIYGVYGKTVMTEYDTKFSQEKKDNLIKILFDEKKLPEFDIEVESVSYLDGCKILFKNGGWIIARFSGTEPVIRIFCEMERLELAEKTTMVLRQFLNV